MVLYKGYCRPLGKKVDFTVEDVISMNTKRGVKWRVKGKFEDYNISTFCSAEKAQELLSQLPLRMDAEIAYTPPPTTYEAEELIPSFSNNIKPSQQSIITYEAEELVPHTIKKSKAEEVISIDEQIQENTNAQELELQSEKLPAKYYKKDGSLDMRYTVCREFAAKQAESQNAVELEAPYTPIEPERPSDDYGGGGRHRKKPRRPLGAEGGEEPETITHVIVLNEGESGNSIRKKIRNAFDKVGYQISPVPKKMKGLTYLGSNSNPVETFIYNEHINKFRNALEEQGLSPLFAEVFNSYWDIPDKKMKHYNKVGWPAPYSTELEYINEYHDAESFDAEDMITITGIDWETDGEEIDLPTTMEVPSDLEEDEIADYLSDQKGWLVNGFVMGAESFEAAYTPEQRLDDYTPEQITTSSAVTGDFFEDSLKYSYGGFQAETEELGETSYAEDVPDLQRAEAGMEVEDIEQAYKKKEDQFMTLVVDDATLFRLAPEIPAFVEIEPSGLAGYTTLKFNFVENPEMEQQILSYAINVVDDKDDQAEEPEFKEGDVRNRLFNVEFDDWAEQEMLTHGKDVSFKEWADEESESHGDEEFMDWAKHEEESHDERYEAEGTKRRSFKVWGMKEGRKYWQDKFELQMQDWLEFAWANRDNPEFKTYQGETLVRNNMGVKKSNIPTGTKMRNVINTDELYKAWKKQSPVIEATAEKRCLVSYQEAVPEMHIFLDYMEDAGIDIKEAEWRNLSDFEMGDRDRYALGDEIIAISQTLRENKVDDWRAVKKLGKAIKQGKFTRVRDEMENIGIYSRRGVWDKHHKDFFELFSDSQIQALGIPWVVNDYRAEITDEDLSELESKLDRKIDSYVKGLNYTQCVACDKEAKVEILEDKEGKALYHFYSCECGHNDIQDSSYDAESANKYQLMAEEVGGLYQVLNNKGFKIEFDNGYELSVMIGAGTYSDNYDMSPIGEMARGLESSTAEIAVIHNGLMLPLDATGGSTVIGYFPTSVLPSLLEAVSKGDDDEIRNVVGQFKRGDFDAESFEAPARETKKRKICDTCHKQKITPDASRYATTCATCTRRGLSKGAESFKADGFIGQIPKSKSMGEKSEILKNNVRIIFEEAQRPLYPMEVMTLYEQKKYGDKPQRKSKYKSSPRAKKLGITQRNLTRIVNTQPDKYYVSRRGLIHYIGEGSMQDYIKNLDPKYFAEDETSKMPNDDIILKYLENSHRSIRKYNAPYRYSSKGMAEKFGVSQSVMRFKMGRMERAGKVKSTMRRCEDAPEAHRIRKLKIFYLPDKRLMGAENYSPSYMVDSDVDSLVDSSERLEDMVDERKEYPEWWKSQLSVSSDKVDGLADFLEYAERNDKV